MFDKKLAPSKRGMAPGTLIYEGDTEPKKTSVICYELNSHGFQSSIIESPEKLPSVSESSIYWIRVIGLADIPFITELGKTYGISHLTLEDILDTAHRAKFEDDGSYMFVIMKQLVYNSEDAESTIGQISVLLMNGIIITFEEWETEELSAIVKRTLHKSETFFTKGSVYLAYTMIDSIVDNYLAELNVIESDIEDLEDKMMEGQTPVDTDELFELKRRVNTLHRTTRPTTEIVDKLSKSVYINFSGIIASDFFKDLSDHAIRLNDNIQNSKDAINAMYDENMSRMQLSSNNIISILTVFSILFLPPMVISGIYGMNFEKMPGLATKYGFFGALALMLIASGFLLLFFKKKKFF